MWVKSPPQQLKCNMDAAVFQESPHVGYGFLLRDDTSALIMAKAGRLFGVADQLEAEALTCRAALGW